MNDRAFEEESLRCLREIWNVVLRTVREPATAEDLVQEAVLRAFQHRHELRNPDAFRSWILAIARTVALNHLQKEKRRRGLVVIEREDALPEGLDGLPSLDLSPEAVESLDGSDVGQALDDLPAAMAEAVKLRDVGELTYEEIANIQGVPVGTVCSRIARGRERLADALRHVAARCRTHPGEMP